MRNASCIDKSGVWVGAIWGRDGKKFHLNGHPFTVKISTIIRNKLHLSQKEYMQLIIDGKITTIPAQNLKKSRMKQKITLVFNS